VVMGQSQSWAIGKTARSVTESAACKNVEAGWRATL